MKNIKEAGQSTIEFIFCFIFAVSLILLVFNTSLNYAAGYVTHYATFMASRVFLTQGSYISSWGPAGRSDAEAAARKAFNDYDLSILGIQPGAFHINDNPLDASAGQYLMIGAYAQFERKIDLIGQITGQNKLELISESYLGREPTQGVCAQRVCKAITNKETCEASKMDITLFDDGC